MLAAKVDDGRHAIIVVFTASDAVADPSLTRELRSGGEGVRSRPCETLWRISQRRLFDSSWYDRWLERSGDVGFEDLMNVQRSGPTYTRSCTMPSSTLASNHM